MNRIKVGTLVRISKHPINTEGTYHTNESMIPMLGKNYRVETISNKCVGINGWSWHIDDLHSLDHDEKSIFKFDEKELVMDDPVV